NNNVTVFGTNPYWVAFRNQLAFTNVPNLLGEGAVGTTVFTWNEDQKSGIGSTNSQANEEGPGFVLTMNYNGLTQSTRPLGYIGQGNAPSAAAVQSALNDLPMMAALGGPLSVTASTSPGGVTTYNVIYARSEVQRLVFTPNSAGAAATGGTF